jgi:hypothetical protein
MTPPSPPAPANPAPPAPNNPAARPAATTSPVPTTTPTTTSPATVTAQAVSNDELDLAALANLNITGRASSRPASVLTKDSAIKVLKAIKTKKGLNSVNEALLLVTGLVQNGGSNRKAGSSVSYSIFHKTLTTAELATIIKSEINSNATIRQFCRGFADEIAAAAETISEEGDLAIQMRRDDPSLSSEIELKLRFNSNYIELKLRFNSNYIELKLRFNSNYIELKLRFNSNYHGYWCSNFQTTNPNCPEKVRNWLLKNFKERFKR